jgi:hypothetical protein
MRRMYKEIMNNYSPLFKADEAHFLPIYAMKESIPCKSVYGYENEFMV